uniref:Putative secreted protein n=1 Tax=Anopheles darlingi TaxID=43151 RepID=A0A2M4DKY9_ANODA
MLCVAIALVSVSASGPVDRGTDRLLERDRSYTTTHTHARSEACLRSCAASSSLLIFAPFDRRSGAVAQAGPWLRFSTSLGDNSKPAISRSVPRTQTHTRAVPRDSRR